MFWIFIVIGACLLLGGCWLFFHIRDQGGHGTIGGFVAVVGLGFILMAFFTAQGHMYYQKLVASGVKGNWIVIDNSGGETLRHWILEDAYVASSDRSDGWQFYCEDGAPAYVAGDSFVMKIKKPLDEFLVDYKQKYNIPPDQRALK